jgi:tetratricopeptide (TPR) repeat protein
VVLGQAYLWKKQYEQAITEAERAVALDPNNADGYVTLGDILVNAGRPEEGVKVTEKALRLNPRLEDDGFTDQDLEAAILNGEIVRREQDNIGRPKYVIEGTARDGRGLTAVVQPFQIRQLIVIVTAYET